MESDRVNLTFCTLECCLNVSSPSWSTLFINLFSSGKKLSLFLKEQRTKHQVMTLLTFCSWGHFFPVFRVYFSKKVSIENKIRGDDQRLLPLKTVMFKTFQTEWSQCIFLIFTFLHFTLYLIAFFFFFFSFFWREMDLATKKMEESMQPNMNSILGMCIGGTFDLMNIFSQIWLMSVLWSWVQFGKLRNFWFCFHLVVWGINF